MDNDLMRLRAQIDLVDQQILDLLSRRLKMAEQVAEVKPNGASVFRPDREAQLLARLCAAADPQLQPVIIAVWRAVISASIARQYPDFTILMTDESEQTARLFAAGQLSVKQTGMPLELCHQLAIGAADIGIVEADELNSIYRQLGLDQPVKIIAGLPLLRPPDSIPTAFILGTQLPDKTTQDRLVTYDERQRIIDLAAVAEENLPSDRSVLGICTLIG